MRIKVEEFLARILPYVCVTSLGVVSLWYMVDRQGFGVWLGMFLVLVIWMVYWRREHVWTVTALLVITGTFVGVYGLVTKYEQRNTYTNIPVSGFVRFIGVVVEAPDVRFDKQFITVQPEGVKYNVRIRLDGVQRITVGDRVIVSGQASRPESFVGDSGIVFDYPAYLAVDNTVLEIKGAKVQLEGSFDNRYWVQRELYQVRQFLSHTAARFLSTRSLGLALGTTIGSREYISDDMMDTYRVAGISHIVVLSGFNVTIIAVALRLVLGRARLSRTWLTGIIIGFVWLFVGIVGFSPSIMRAGIMLSILLIATLFDRQSSGMRSLLYATSGMVMINPRILLDDIGFQLSVCATFGLFVFAPILERLLPGTKSGVVGGVREVVIATIAATLATLPVLIYEVGSISGLGLIANIAVVWLVPFIMLGVLIVVVCSWLPVVANVIGLIVGMTVYFVNTTALFIARVSPQTITANAVLLLAITIVLYWLFWISASVQGDP